MSAWAIALTHGRGEEVIHADRVRVEDGALLFVNGDIFHETLIYAYAAGLWERACPMADPDEDDD